MTHQHSNKLHQHIDAILDLMEDGIFISDSEGLTLKVNKAYEQLTGMHHSELEGKTVFALQEQGVFNRILNPLIVKSGEPASAVQELGKEKKTIHMRGFPVLDDAGKVRLVATFARDVTAITQLREQIARQRTIIEQYQGRMDHMLEHRPPVDGVFASKAMQGVLQALTKIAATDATVLLLGETGVGKDVLARVLHARSPRKDRIFLKVDCGSIAENLIESELFGYVRGAFSGANSQGKAGYFEVADGGTLFLDEVGELPLSMQTRLLRVLQDQEIVRVGASAPRKVDVRIVAATNRDLKADIADGKFRQDLYFRLNVAKIRVPALRDRGEDIPLLARHFLELYNLKYKKHIHLSARAAELLTRYSWPGNVREMQNMMLSLVITSDSELLDVANLPSRVREMSGQPQAAPLPAAPLPAVPGDQSLLSAVLPVTVPDESRPLKEIMAGIEAGILRRAVERHGSVGKVAKMFGINRSTLFRKLQQAKIPGTEESGDPIPSPDS